MTRRLKRGINIMDIDLLPSQIVGLNEIAERTGRGTDDLVRESVDQMLSARSKDGSSGRASEPYYEPWIGKDYERFRVLIMSESAYDWLGDDGEINTPQRSHAKAGIPWHIANFGQNQYFKSLNRALCGKLTPSAEEMEGAWDGLAYTIFVQESVGRGAGKRPKSHQWQDAGPHFLALLENIRPLKVMVTGKDMWEMMPDTALRLLDELQAYRLLNGELVWCLALPHPANRRGGFKWETIWESIRLFRETSFPER
jgi:hypothetical protein